MEHKYIIFFLIKILILIIIYYEYCYKNIVMEKFEVQLGKWDNVIGLQILRDMMGIFFDESKKTFNIPGGISVKELVPALANISTPQQRDGYMVKLRPGKDPEKIAIDFWQFG